MNNTLLLLLLFIMIEKDTDNKTSSISSINKFISTMEINEKYTLEKIHIMKKVGPYFPKNYTGLINKSISFTEKFIKLNEIVEFMKKDDEEYILEHIPTADSKDRMNKILSTIKKEFPKSTSGETGTIMDLLLNIDQYQKMFGILNTVMNNQDDLNDPSKLISLIGPLMGGDMEENSAKFKEMTNMMKILQSLDSPKSDTLNKDK